MNWKGDTSSFMFCMFPLSPHSSPDLWHLCPFLDVIHHSFFKNMQRNRTIPWMLLVVDHEVWPVGGRGWQAVKRDQGVGFFRYVIYSQSNIAGWKIKTEPKTHLVEKEYHLPNIHFWVPCSFSRVYQYVLRARYVSWYRDVVSTNPTVARLLVLLG